ncbi:MAG TPA: S9 family peptidase, partial [Bacteroidales bacterium]|nr:S9 family peptidase [Bacteroidales bacterium]
YTEMSPFTYADKVKSPMLLIHGSADNNPGTFTLQSERYFQALKGHGAVARLVLLPYESHGYASRDNIMHVLWEQDQWFKKYLKN